ncbi:SDR family oxidoreductase [uncultured Pseudoteredinibacter sp.]|uniref:SDR family NAD(P)-dependent oxidoreductase n=1 Tax=uncultured Pseudoteredinibacter sp. TaxID=1641701 RepID=UPI002602531B|nr:SDR family oxidoreductase [uncultured Pseudoteredinibacter sp.]
MKLKNKTTLITGASRGIGLSIAKRFLSEGANVVVSYLAEDYLVKDDQLILESYADQCLIVECDVRIDQHIEACVEQTLSRFSSIDTLINNAGVAHNAPLEETSMDQFDELMNVNLRGAFNMSRCAIPSMLEATVSSNIINISSELAYLGRANNSAYCASKAALIGLTRSWAREFSPKIRVNAIAPGPTSTRMCDPNIMHEEELAMELNNPMKRFGRCSEIASTALFLASEDSSYFTGQCLSPNGGAAMY